MATFHANELGVGFARLVENGLAWVLSRLSIEMFRWPRVSENYTLRTWIEGFNRHFSERDFEITGGDGEVIGYARTIWMAIDIRGRQSGDLSMLDALRDTVCDRPCPIAKAPRMTAVPAGDGAVSDCYRFRYCDCDFNRHVNTVRYMELLLDHWDMDYFDTRQVRRIDMAFMHEAKCSQEVTLTVADAGDDTYNAEITLDGTALTRARVTFAPFEFKQQLQ